MTNNVLANAQPMAAEEMAERMDRLERANERLLLENERLNHEMEKMLHRLYGMNERVASRSYFGHTVLVACLVSVLLMAIYGMGYIEFPNLQTAINDYPVVENLQ